MAAQIRLRGTGPEEDRMEAWEVMLGIFHAWRDGRPRDMRPLLDDDVVMVLPGSGDRIGGAEAMLAAGATVLDAPADYTGQRGYSRGYYAAFYADPDGIKIEVAHIPDANP